MKIYIGSDHGGFDLKQLLVHFLGVKQALNVEDVHKKQHTPADDFPTFAAQIVYKIQTSDDSTPQAILVCADGQGAAMAANRFRGIRAAVCWNEGSARKARAELDSNFLCIPAHDLPVDTVKDIIHAWLNTPFARTARHQRAITELDSI